MSTREAIFEGGPEDGRVLDVDYEVISRSTPIYFPVKQTASYAEYASGASPQFRISVYELTAKGRDRYTDQPAYLYVYIGER